MINSLLKFQNKKQTNHKIKRVNPHVSWMVLLRFVFIIIVLLIGGSLYLMYQIKNDQIFTAKTDDIAPPSVLDENLLEKVNNIFIQRATNRDIIESNDLLYKDPSIK